MTARYAHLLPEHMQEVAELTEPRVARISFDHHDRSSGIMLPKLPDVEQRQTTGPRDHDVSGKGADPERQGSDEADGCIE